MDPCQEINIALDSRLTKNQIRCIMCSIFLPRHILLHGGQSALSDAPESKRISSNSRVGQMTMEMQKMYNHFIY